MKLKKMGIVDAAMALAVFTLCSLTACGPSPEDTIREAITDEFDGYKNADDSVIQQIAQSAEKQGISQYGIENEEFATMVLDGFDYSINSIEVDGNSATANLTIVSKSSAAFKEKLTESINAISQNPELASMTDDQKMELISEAITNSFKDIETVSEDVSIEYAYTDSDGKKIWVPVNSGTALGSLDSVVFAQTA